MAYIDKCGVAFSDDRKTLINCPEDFHGEYIIPDSVEYIENKAFAYCTNLLSVDLGDGVEKIGDEAFVCCKNLRKIRFGINLKKIGRECFIKCDKIHVILWDAIACADFEHAWMPFAWGAEPIKGDWSSWPTHFIESVKYIYLGKTVKHIPSYLCARFSDLEELVIPDSVESIGEAAFAYCNPKYIYLNKEISLYDIKQIFGGHCMSWDCRCEDIQLAENPFYYCDRLEEIEVSPQNAYFASKDGNLYDKSFSRLIKICCTSSSLSLNVNEIDDFAGIGLEIKELAISNCNSIGKYAFYGCENLQSVTFNQTSNDKEYLFFHSFAFGNCPELKELYWDVIDGHFRVSESSQIDGIIGDEYFVSGERYYDFARQITHVTLGKNVIKIPDFLSLLLNVKELRVPQNLTDRIGEIPVHLMQSVKIEEQDKQINKQHKKHPITEGDMTLF